MFLVGALFTYFTFNCTIGEGDKDSQDQKDTKTCIPLVSEYTDCTPATECSGCTKCVCSATGRWECRSVRQCEAIQTDQIDEELFDAAIEKLDYELKTQKRTAYRWKRDTWVASRFGGKSAESDELLDLLNSFKLRQRLKQSKRRPKRSAKKVPNERRQKKRSAEKTTKKTKQIQTSNNNNNNHTIKFYSTVDELNEDTLAKTNISGTLHAKRVQLNIPVDISRRSNTDNTNKSLRIDFSQSKVSNHITDNKIDTEHENKIESHEKQLHLMLGNYTQTTKDKELSKIVVNELRLPTEIIGDKNAPITSNITFTAENDTLTAMAFIAGNLLNKLWNIEKDASDTSWETDEMKQEKISDLLDLFKEPLNLRQEKFLKNALKQLSSAIENKDIQNISLCETIEDAKKIIDHSNTDDENTPNETNVVADKVKPCRKNNFQKDIANKQDAAVKAISKINNVLGLIKKYETVQKNLTLLKYGTNIDLNDTVVNKNIKNLTKATSKKLIIDTLLTKDETSSLNTFGNLLNKITKLLMPKSNKKSITSELKHKNMLGTDKDFRSNLNKMFGIDFDNISISAKDKLILDYITHMNNNPDCVMNKKHRNKSIPVLEGNILLNLSEFFKMKSFADLVNMLHLEKKVDSDKTVSITTTTNRPIKSTTAASISDKSLKLLSTKERLKAHLRSIIEDLIELQHAKGIKTRGNIRVTDALPCIYNIMNAGKETHIKITEQSNAAGKIVDIFNGLKHDIKLSQGRRSDSILPVRPKSAIVLERIVQNLVDKTHLKTRRFLDLEVKPTDELTHIINKMKNISSVYKNQALYHEVPAAERLMLLKTLSEDVRNYIVALERVKIAFKNSSLLSSEQYNNLAAFIVNSVQNISLNEKVIKKVKTLEFGKQIMNQMDAIEMTSISEKSPILRSYPNNGDGNMIISRNQIINHLIRNRMKMYMKLKESQIFDVDSDLNYNIAKKVLFYLDAGNLELAHELFKTLVMQKHDNVGTPAGYDYTRDLTLSPPIMNDIPIRRDGISHLQPLIQFEEPKNPSDQLKWMNQDHLIKQLLNIKNMGL